MTFVDSSTGHMLTGEHGDVCLEHPLQRVHIAAAAAGTGLQLVCCSDQLVTGHLSCSCAGDGPRLSAARLSRTPGTHDCTLTICCHLLTTTVRNINRNFNNNISPGQLNIVAGEYPKASNMWVSLGVQSPSHVWPWPWLYFEARSEASVWKMMQREVWWGVGSKQSWPS